MESYVVQRRNNRIKKIESDLIQLAEEDDDDDCMMSDEVRKNLEFGKKQYMGNKVEKRIIVYTISSISSMLLAL